MTYLGRKQAKDGTPPEKKQKSWEKTEDDVRWKLGFTFDRHCRALGIDGVKVTTKWYLGDQEVSEEQYNKVVDPIQALMIREDDGVWELLSQLLVNIIGTTLGRELTQEEFDSKNFEETFLPMVDDWLYDFIRQIGMSEMETQPIEKTTVTFLEVKDWQEGQKVNADEIDKFVGKMVRGDAAYGVFVAKSFSRSVKQVVRDHNAMLKKSGKSLEVLSFDKIKRSIGV